MRKIILCFCLFIFEVSAIEANSPADSIYQATIKKSVMSLSRKYKEISRVVKFDFYQHDIPQAFDSCRIAFISDTHYKSLFDEKGLPSLTRLLRELKPDILMMGGDYQEGCEYVEELFDSIAAVKPKMGIYGVLGNNDYERCTDQIRLSMIHHGMHLLEQRCDTVVLNGSRIILAGIENSTASDSVTVSRIGICPTRSLHFDDFVILLTHTPDYAEEYDITNTDLVLAGHTHGGQVLILGRAPKVPSRYGERFLTGLKHNSAGVPMIITNGIGTSQVRVRIGAHAEVVLITLHSTK